MKETIYLQHPHTGDVQAVEVTPEDTSAVVPLLVTGYQQIPAPPPAEEVSDGL